MNIKIKLSLGALLLILVVVFTLQNSEVVNINFLFWSFSLSRALMIFVVFIAGVLLGTFFGNYSKIMAKVGKKGSEEEA